MDNMNWHSQQVMAASGQAKCDLMVRSLCVLGSNRVVTGLTGGMLGVFRLNTPAFKDNIGWVLGIFNIYQPARRLEDHGFLKIS